MVKSKSINLFLMDGEPSCRIKCTMQNWTGVAYKIPRAMLDECKSGEGDIVKHLKQTGIYFLFGEDLDSGNLAVYVGQAVARKNGDGLLCRLLEHKRNSKEKWIDWNEVVVFTTQNNSFGPTEISYLENKFTNMARQTGRYVVKNGNDPNVGNFTEEKESELLEYIDFSQIIMGVLGHKVFEPILNTSSVAKKNQGTVFYFKGKFDAKAMFTNEGFVVLKDSEISPVTRPSMHESCIKARELNKNKISQDFKLLDNILFTSPSAAAGFVGGLSLSGNVVWQTKDGKTPKDVDL